MKGILFAVLLGVFLFAGCMVGPGYRGEGMVVVPALPTIVVLESEPYYYQGGYHYHYQNDRWYYSHARSGPWAELPRGHYPKEVRYKGKGDDRGKDYKHGGDKHGDDKRDRY